MSDWWDYVVRTAGTEIQKKMADDTGISETAFSRWKKGQNKPEAPHVIVFARKYRRPPVEALIAAGILTEGDAPAIVEVHRKLTSLTDHELLEEVLNRMKGDRHGMEDPSKPHASPEGRKNKEALSGKPRSRLLNHPKPDRPFRWAAAKNPRIRRPQDSMKRDQFGD